MGNDDVLNLCSATGVRCVEIRELSVPSLVEYNASDHVILDCDYDLSEDDSGSTVVNWLFEEKHYIMQWIIGRKPPQLIDQDFKEHVDLGFSVDVDSARAHRALKLRRPTPSLSGRYMCKVSSNMDEDFMQKRMVVYGEIRHFEGKK